jgi:hypothetical protein
VAKEEIESSPTKLAKYQTGTTEVTVIKTGIEDNAIHSTFSGAPLKRRIMVVECVAEITQIDELEQWLAWRNFHWQCGLWQSERTSGVFLEIQR